MEPPLAYLITVRTYGTWLHGDERGSFAGERNMYRTEGLPPDPALRRSTARLMHGTPQRLDAERRGVMARTVEEVCEHRGWQLHACAVRTEHIHVVVSADGEPERVMTSLKAWATRRAREAGLVKPDQRLWSRHGSTVYLWREAELRRAIRYVLEGQGPPLEQI